MSSIFNKVLVKFSKNLFWRVKMNYGKNLKSLRLSQNLSQKELSKAPGISQQALSFWEQDKHIPNMDDCIKLADFYKISLDELVDRYNLI